MRAYVEREKFFAGAASHESRTPLTVITQTLEILACRPQTDSVTIAALERLSHITNGMTATVRGLFSLACSEKQEFSQFRPEPILLAVLEDLLHGKACAHTEGDWFPASPSRKVCLSAPQTQRARPLFRHIAAMVVHNLVENALRYDTGDVRILLDADGSEITNRGHYQPDASGTPGFGPTITQRACERMGCQLLQVQEGDEARFQGVLRWRGNR